jgi:ATP-dependent Clp protease ATP-binding subunit ClpA
MLSSELETCLNAAFKEAREARHEFLTVEHLLLAILDAPKVREILKAGGADLRRLAEQLREHVEATTPHLKPDEDREVQPTLGFQRVLQRAVFQVQSGGRREVGWASKGDMLRSSGKLSSKASGSGLCNGSLKKPPAIVSFSNTRSIWVCGIAILSAPLPITCA